jgi:hypothetical protein
MHPLIRTVTLTAATAQAVDQALEAGASGEVVLRFQVLHVASGGKALVWFSAPHARLGVLQLAFPTVCDALTQPPRPRVDSRWTVLAKRDGCYVVAQWEAPRCVVNPL